MFSSYVQDATSLKIGEEHYAFVRNGDISAKW